MRIPGWHGAWILNPDTEPSPDALSEAVEHAVTYHKGMVGRTLVPYTDRERVYCRAGHRWWKFRTKLGIIGSHEPVNGLVDVQVVEGSLDCVSGACMYVTRLFVEEIGPMDERFFITKMQIGLFGQRDADLATRKIRSYYTRVALLLGRHPADRTDHNCQHISKAETASFSFTSTCTPFSSSLISWECCTP
jgi:hypothetical protein